MNSLQTKISRIIVASLLLFSSSAWAITISVEDVVSASIDVAGETDEYTFNANAGQSLFFDRQAGSASSLSWVLLSPSNQETFRQFGWRDTGPVSVTETGVYTLRLTGNGSSTPTYQFQILEVPPVSNTDILIGEVVNGNIAVQGEVDEYTFDGSAGQILYLDRQMGSISGINWVLFSPSGSEVFRHISWRDFGPLALAETGQYLLRVDGNGDARPEYQFQIHLVPEPRTTATAIGEVVSGRLTVPGQLDYFTFAGRAGQIISLEKFLGTNTHRYHWTLYGPDGSEVGSANNLANTGQVLLPDDGQYTLEINGVGDGVGQFVARIWDVPPDVPRSIALDTPVSEAFAALAERQTYYFDAVAGQDLLLDLNLNPANAIRFDLYQPDGTRIFRNRTSNRSVSPVPETGTYTLIAHSLKPVAGYFNFRLVSSLTPLPFPAAADLVVTSISNPVRVIGSPAEFEVSWEVSNIGSVATNANEWIDRVEFRGQRDFVLETLLGQSQNNTFSIEAQVAHSGVLAPGESYTQTVTFSHQPEADYHGAFDVVVIADADNAVFENVQEDNSLTASDKTAVYPQSRLLTGEGAIRVDLADGSVLPAGVEFALGGQANFSGGAVNAVFILDVSLSTNFVKNLDANGDGAFDARDDLNGDGSVGDILDTEIGAILRISEQLAASADDVLVAVVPFDNFSRNQDIGPGEHTQIFQHPDLEKNGSTGVSDLKTALGGLRPAYGTNFQAALQSAAAALNNAQPADQTLVFFLTDGDALVSPSAEEIDAFAARGMRFFAYQIGNPTVTSSLDALVQGIDAHAASSGTGTAIVDPNDLAAGLLRSLNLVSVNINGTAVDVLDAEGVFYTPVTLSEGPNPFNIEAFDNDGNSISKAITLVGTAPGSLIQSEDITGDADISYRNTRYNRASGRLHVDAFLTNTGPFNMRNAVQAELDIRPPAATLQNAEGVSPAGRSLIVFDDELGLGLGAAQTSAALALKISNPREDRITIAATLSSLGNNPPAFVSLPVVLINEGESYSYIASATDIDGDALLFSLAQAPSGMAVDPSSGEINWLPSTAQLGVHPIELLVDDGQGGTATQAFQVSVSNGLPDLPPVITSTPSTLAIRDIAYRYDMRALDPEGNVLTYILDDAPAGMSINVASGVISFMPVLADVGTHTVTVRVTDPAGNAGHQSWSLTVRNENQPPVFTSAPVTQVAVGEVYRYRAVATDDGVVSYALRTAPAGMSIDPDTGSIRMTALVGQLGTQYVVVQAQDDMGETAEQTYMLDVGLDSEPPSVSVILSNTLLELGESVDVNVLAVDNLAVESTALFVDGVATPLNSGAASVTPSSVGLYQFRGTAADFDGNSGENTVQLRVIDPADNVLPVITITSPLPGDTVARLSDITGSVTAADLEFYRVEFAPQHLVDVSGGGAQSSHWQLLAEANSEVSDSLLAVFDPTVLRNDGYVIRVVAQDFSGNIATQALPVYVAAGAKPGRFSLEYTDLSMPLAGIPIEFTRRYDSFSANTMGDFGYGWRLSIGNPDLRETLPVAPNEALVGFFAANAYITGTRVYLTNPDGKRIGFTFEPVAAGSGLLGTIFSPQFTPDPGVTDRLEVDDAALTQTADGRWVMYMFGFNYNPEDFRLIRKSGVAYHYNQFTGLSRIGDANGNELTITDAGVFHSSGAAIPFVRDAQGRITQITDPDGGLISYEYDTDGNLTSVIYQDGLAMTYDYLDSPAHYVSQVTDPTGRSSARYEYDGSGRIVAVTDALGNRIEQTWDPANFRGGISDAKGNFTEFVYDENGNILEETDPLGGFRQYTYDANNNQTSVTDENGNTTYFSYDSRGNRLSKTDALGGVLTYAYDESGNRTSISGQLGDVYWVEYDSYGNTTQLTNPRGGVISSSFDMQGRMIEYTDLNGNVVTYEYDTAFSSASRLIDSAGEVQHFEYNWFGAVTRQVDTSGGITEYTYDRQGYMLSARDAVGSETDYQYINGRLTEMTDANGNAIRYEYDEAGRLTVTTDGAGNALRHTYDANGNRVSTIDPQGNSTLFVYDALNRLVEKTDPLGNTTRYTYDAVDNLIQVIDRNGREKRFEYDVLGRVITETWLDGSLVVNVIRSVYDVAGRRLSLVDNNAAFAYVYDALNQVVRADIAGIIGLPPMSLSSVYDANQNRIQVSDNLGVSVDTEYDELNRPIMRLWQGVGVAPQQIHLNYDARSNLVDVDRNNAGVSLASSGFTYDAVGRISGLFHADSFGSPLVDYSYNYDALGLLSSQSHHGETVNYLYDNTNQLLSADSSRYGVTNYAYDANGNPATGFQMTGAGNRLLTDGVFNYQYDAEGNTIRKTDIASGDYHRYFYDHRNRLVREEQRALDTTIMSESVYVYDALDRRIKVTVDGVTTVTVYDNDNVWGDFDALGNPDTYYLFGNTTDELFARSRNGDTDWYLTDRLGTVRDIVDGLGSVINQLDYDSFGYVLAETDATQGDRFRFTGREQNSVGGLYYYRARYYDPVLGRFISEDPMGFESGDFNFYRYVNNSPQNATDPSGKLAATEYAVIVTVFDTLCTAGGAASTGMAAGNIFWNIAICLESLATDEEACGSLKSDFTSFLKPNLCGVSP